MYSYSVKPSNKKAYMISGALYTGALVLLLVSVNIPLYRAVFQGLMLISLVAAITVTERYSLSVYEYVIEQNAGEPDLVVYRTLGHKTKAQCRLCLYEAGELIPVTVGAKPTVAGRVYDYTATVSPDSFYYLTFPDESVTLKLEPDEKFAGIIEGLMHRSEDRDDYSKDG